MAASTDHIRAGLAEILAEIAGAEPSDLTDDTSFGVDLRMDTLSVIELAVAAEEMFDVKIPTYKLPALRTVGYALVCIEAELQSELSTSGGHASAA